MYLFPVCGELLEMRSESWMSLIRQATFVLTRYNTLALSNAGRIRSRSRYFDMGL